MVELGRWSSLVKDSGLGTEKASEPEIAGSNPARPTYIARLVKRFSCFLSAKVLLWGVRIRTFQKIFFVRFEDCDPYAKEAILAATIS